MIGAANSAEAGYRLTSQDATQRAIAMATEERPGLGASDECSDRKAIVIVAVVLSENRAEGLVRPVYRGDGAAVRKTHP